MIWLVFFALSSIEVYGDIIAGASFTLHPPNFIQVEQYPIVRNLNIDQRETTTCREANLQLCNQGCWANLALSLAGLVPRLNLCTKYAPETSCLTQSLNFCSNMMNNNMKLMMIAFGKIIVAWCYDNGLTLNALNQHSECLSMAMFDSMTTQGCLLNMLSPMALSMSNNAISGSKIDLMKLLTNIAITYQSSTVLCMHKSIKDACGVEAANLALGQAIDELSPKLSTMPEKKESQDAKNETLDSPTVESSSFRSSGQNVQNDGQLFDQQIKMWVYEEKIEVRGEERLLSDCINQDHENYKYLPGYKLPANVIAVTNLIETIQDADILLFIVPHQFIHKICSDMKNHVKPGAMGVTLIKGVSSDDRGEIRLISEEISAMLNIPVSSLMGANLAREVAQGNFCESTLGCTMDEWSPILRQLFDTPNFRVNVVRDSHTVELCGALKNIVAMAAGFCDGLGCGDNTKAAVIRLGLMEILQFVECFYAKSGFKLSTLFESCGVADLITTCYGGRNRRCSEAFVKTKKNLDELEREMLNGQRLQGPHTAAQVYNMLEKRDMLKEFPLFVAVHKICIQKMQPEDMIDCLRNHPTHLADIPADQVDI